MKRLLIALLALAAAAPVLAGKGEPAKPAGQSYTWYDGDQPRQVWLDPGLVAEFGNAKSNASSAVRGVTPQAQEVKRQGTVRVWRVEDAPRALMGLRSVQPAGKFSPVLRDQPGERGALRALPGNVIVKLDPAWSEAQVQAWLREHGLESVRRLGHAPNAYLVKSEPGLAALELANSLHGQPGVLAASPDWWQEVEKR